MKFNIYAIMKFNMHRSVDKTIYFLDSLITRESLKLVDDIANMKICKTYQKKIKHAC